MRYSYEIKKRPAGIGAGWQLSLLENGQEVGGGIFPPGDEAKDADEALQTAFEDAERTAYEWLDSRQEEDI